jgi:hypothetical protein
MDWEVGQAVLVVDRLTIKHGGRPATIGKIGRKWITLDDGKTRFDAATHVVDNGGYSSSGMVYASQLEYEESQNLALAWQDFKGRMRELYHHPAHLTIADIESMIAKLTPPEK